MTIEKGLCALEAALPLASKGVNEVFNFNQLFKWSSKVPAQQPTGRSKERVDKRREDSCASINSTYSSLPLLAESILERRKWQGGRVGNSNEGTVSLLRGLRAEAATSATAVTSSEKVKGFVKEIGSQIWCSIVLVDITNYNACIYMPNKNDRLNSCTKTILYNCLIFSYLASFTFEKHAPMWTLGVGGSPLEACLAPCGSDDSVDGCGEPDWPRWPDRPRFRGGAWGPSPLPDRESLSDLLGLVGEYLRYSI